MGIETARVGNGPQLSSGQVFGLATQLCLGSAERGAVGGDAGDGHHPGLKIGDERLESPATLDATRLLSVRWPEPWPG